MKVSNEREEIHISTTITNFLVAAVRLEDTHAQDKTQLDDMKTKSTRRARKLSSVTTCAPVTMSVFSFFCSPGRFEWLLDMLLRLLGFLHSRKTGGMCVEKKCRIVDFDPESIGITLMS